MDTNKHRYEMEIGREFLSTNGTNRHEKGKGKLGRDFKHGWTQTNTDKKWELGGSFCPRIARIDTKRVRENWEGSLTTDGHKQTQIRNGNWEGLLTTCLRQSFGRQAGYTEKHV